jgi:hypothetical protein
MPAHAIKRLLFDPRYQFVVTPPYGRTSLSVGGAALQAGTKFDPSLVDGRRLRQMYDARLISVAPGHAPLPAASPRRRAIGPARNPPQDGPPPAAPVGVKRGGVLRRPTLRQAS